MGCGNLEVNSILTSALDKRTGHSGKYGAFRAISLRLQTHVLGIHRTNCSSVAIMFARNCLRITCLLILHVLLGNPNAYSEHGHMDDIRLTVF